MKGKIVSYDPICEMGKIEISTGHTFDFDLYSFTTEDKDVKVGANVLFDLFDKRAVNIEPFEKSDILYTIEKDEDKLIESKEFADILNLNSSYIATDTSTAINNYFSNLIVEYEQNKKYIKYRKSLDYEKLERFLTSAYNNLLEIDYNFRHKNLSDTKEKIDRLYKIYIYFKKITKFTKSAYNIIFLSKHPEQKALQKRLETNRDKIVSMNIEIEKIEERLKELKRMRKSESNLKIMKKLKKELVDTIHERSFVIEENKKVAKKLKDFYDKHYPSFKEYLKEFKDFYGKNLKYIIDVIAFQFDKEIWRRAKQSDLITEYFEKAGLKNDFSALSYLKYYLKSIDMTKANEEHYKLYELKEYLEDQKRKSILCYDDNPNFLSFIKESVKKIDKDINIILSSRREMTLSSVKNYYPYALIINPNIKEINIEKFLPIIRNYIPDIEVSFLVDKVDKNLLLMAKKVGVSSILRKTSNKDEFIKQIEKYVKNL